MHQAAPRYSLPRVEVSIGGPRALARRVCTVFQGVVSWFGATSPLSPRGSGLRDDVVGSSAMPSEE